MGTSKFSVYAACFASLMSLAGHVQAQQIPDRDTIIVPTIIGGRDAKVVKDGWKYFYFYRPDTSYEEAYADLAECYRFLPVANTDSSLPMHVAWNDAPEATRESGATGSTYGLVGAGIGALVAGPIERRSFQSRMRRCMEPRGYDRYPLTREVWEQVIDDYSQRSIAVQAKIVATGQPDAKPLPVTR